MTTIFIISEYCNDVCPCGRATSEKLVAWSATSGGCGYSVDIDTVDDIDAVDVHVLVKYLDTCDCRYVGKSVPIKAFASEEAARTALAAYPGPFRVGIEKIPPSDGTIQCDSCYGAGTVESLDPDVEFEHCSKCGASGRIDDLLRAETAAKEAHPRDICMYCGVDQGEIIPPSTLGSMRQGWDCWRGCGN